MVLLILILCIVSMTQLNPVTSKNSFELPSDSVPLVDFGFSQLIEELLLAEGESSNRKALSKIITKAQFGDVFETVNTEDAILHQYINSTHKIGSLSRDFDHLLNHGFFVGNREEKLEHLKNFCQIENGLYADLNLFNHKNEETGKNFMDLASEYMNSQERRNSCWFEIQSSQAKISELYHKLVKITAVGYAMRIYAIRENNSQYGYRGMREDTRREYEKTLRNFQKSALSAIANAPTEIHSCNLVGGNIEKNYIELVGIFSPIGINEIYLNEKASCQNTCSDYQNTTFYEYKDDPLRVNICSGRIYNCFEEPINPCNSSETFFKRYSAFEPTSQNGQKMENWCGTRLYHSDVQSKSSDKCDQCICFCSDPEYTESNPITRTFSTKAVESDTSKNKVITGIQFVEIQQTIYVKIQEGTLMPNATVEESTVEWKKVDKIDWNVPIVNPYDYFTITNDNKFVNLDTLVVSDNRVITGIRLFPQGSHLTLQIKSHAFNYATGILENGFWQSYSPMRRKEIKITAPDNPLFMKESIIDTREKTYVGFRSTDYRKDASQTTIPLIHSAALAPHPPVPFSGVGLYYSGQSGYGGFIGFKAVLFNQPRIFDD